MSFRKETAFGMFTSIFDHGIMDSKEVMGMLYDEIIRQRQSELFTEINQLEQEIERLKQLRERRVEEYKMLQHISDRGLMNDERKPARIDFENALKEIFKNAGRPMSIGELIDKLEEFGYSWSTYQTAWASLRRTRLLEHTGARGYYQLVRY